MVINIGYTAAKALLCLCDQHPGTTPETLITLAILQAYHKGFTGTPPTSSQAAAPQTPAKV